MRSSEDAAPMSPEQRLQEVAAILGKGILRLRTRGGLNCNQPDPVDPNDTSENSPRLP
jgi:hypothetical protein